MKYTSVSKSEFDQFMQLYPNDLQRDLCSICAPRQLQYNDFSKADTLVAYISLNEESQFPKEDEYFIMEQPPLTELQQAKRELTLKILDLVKEFEAKHNAIVTGFNSRVHVEKTKNGPLYRDHKLNIVTYPNE